MLRLGVSTPILKRQQEHMENEYENNFKLCLRERAVPREELV